MLEISPGERILHRLRWWVYDAGAGPIVLVAVLMMLGAVAAMAGAAEGASSSSFLSWREWIYSAASGFSPAVQLAVLVASVLLVIDRVSGAAFRGQAVLSGAIVVLAAAGVVANVAAMVASLTEAGLSEVSIGTTAEGWTIAIASYLGPTVIAVLSGGLAVASIRSTDRWRRDTDEPV